MNPSISERLRWSAQAERPGTPAAERAVMARTFAYFFAFGAALAVLISVLPHAEDLNVPGLLAVAALLWAGAAVFILGFDRLPAWSYHPFLVVSVALTAGAAYFAGKTGTAPMATMYFWAALTAFSFFEWRYAVLHTLNIGAVYAVLVTVRLDPDDRVLHWVMLMSAIMVAGMLVKLLRGRLEVLIERLGDAARTDTLTGLLNRRGFDERTGIELARASRSGNPLGFVMVDLDHFKAVNDRFGHPEGDRVLKRLSAVVIRETRLVDVVARLGGEEFAIVLPDTDPEATLFTAERVRCAVKEEFSRPPLALTVSCGVAAVPTDGETLAELLSAADRALYAAKEQGRDRTVVFGAAREAPPELHLA